MHEIGRLGRVPDQRRTRPARHGHVDAEALAKIERVARRRLDGGVAEGRGHRQQFDVRRMVQEQQRHGVVHARIGVEDDLVLHAFSFNGRG